VPRRKKRSEVGARFGASVRRIRTSRRLTQESLAELAGLATDYVGFVERGENVPTLLVILRLARALGVDAADLLEDLTLRTIEDPDLT
jgi:transcriptional regulator with XRE-family HTH domain